MSQTIIKGVPRALVVDGWWMSADAQFESPTPGGRLRQKWGDQTRRRLVLLVALLALADFLFFQQARGISLAVFAVAVFAASVLESAAPKLQPGPVVVLVLGILPVLDYMQFFSVLFLIGGLIISIAWQRYGIDTSVGAVLGAARRLVLYLPIGTVQAITHWVRTPSVSLDVGDVVKTLIRNWAFPIGGGCIILGLLVSANPVLEMGMNDLFTVNWDVQKAVSRVLFWMGCAILLWPLFTTPKGVLAPAFGPMRPRRSWGFGLNAQSVSNALWVFNGMLAVQLIMDGSFAVGGTLPYGMSYAEYAHRGAYPLVATALLAGCFALAARPFLAEGKWLTPLMLVWLGLNALLTVSSMYRLGIYVEAYGLTYLRVRAGIWMVLIIVWLGLIAWQIVRSKANGWLVLRSFALGIGTIYLGCFVNFAEVIARHNLQYPMISTYDYCQYSGTSATALQKTEGASCYNRRTPHIEGWRDWGFREWRVARYVDEMRAKGGSHENLGR